MPSDIFTPRGQSPSRITILSCILGGFYSWYHLCKSILKGTIKSISNTFSRDNPTVWKASSDQSVCAKQAAGRNSRPLFFSPSVSPRSSLISLLPTENTCWLWTDWKPWLRFVYPVMQLKPLCPKLLQSLCGLLAGCFIHPHNSASSTSLWFTGQWGVNNALGHLHETRVPLQELAASGAFLREGWPLAGSWKTLWVKFKMKINSETHKNVCTILSV